MEPGETPLLYKGIVLHSYQGVSHKKYLLKPSSRPNFLKYVESFGNVIGVIPLEEFDPESDELLSPTLPSEVELRDGAQFVVITTSTDTFAERASLASTSSLMHILLLIFHPDDKYISDKYISLHF